MQSEWHQCKLQTRKARAVSFTFFVVVVVFPLFEENIHTAEIAVDGC